MKQRWRKTMKTVVGLVLTFVLITTMLPLDLYAGEFSYREIITPTYDDARTFSEGLAAVRKDGKWGYIDVNGNTVIDFKYDVAHSFSEGKAIVGIRETWEYGDAGDTYDVVVFGFIDKQNNYTPFKWDTLRGDDYPYLNDTPYVKEYIENSTSKNLMFYNGRVKMSEHDGPDSRLFDTEGKEIFTNSGVTYVPTEDVLPVFYSNGDVYYGVGYEDLSGNRLFKDKKFDAALPFNKGLAAVSLEGTDYWNLMDRNGKITNHGKFLDFTVRDPDGAYQLFNNGLMAMSNMDEKWGAVNKAGQTIIPFQYEHLIGFSEGVAGFKQSGKYGYINIDGNEVIKAQFDGVSPFNNGLAAVWNGNDAFLINKKGVKIKETENLPKSSYFKKYTSGEYRIYAPGQYVLTNQNNKYGFGEVSYTPDLPTVEDMSDWALWEVTQAIELDLVPANLQNMYRTDITRVDFAALVVAAIEEVTGESIDDIVKEETGQSLYDSVNKYPFNDTTDKNVIAAHALKIIYGKGEGVFDPHATILRQEAAALLAGTARFLGNEAQIKNTSYSDDDAIAPWAKASVNYASSIGVMAGKLNNNFAPKDNYTREQSYMTIYRLFNVIVNE